MRYLEIFGIIIISIIFISVGKRLIYYPGYRINIFSSKSPIEVYAYARLRLNSEIDPPCTKSKNIYTCFGTCPWINKNYQQFVSCSFLPRIAHPDFVKNNMYCIPDSDQCPTYNAWLKDELPLTTKHISNIPQHLLSNFTLNFSIPIAYNLQDFRTDNNIPTKWTTEYIGKFRAQVRARLPFGTYNNKDIYRPLDKYASLAVQGKKCAVIGTVSPWIEAALLEYNASSVITMEYATINSDVPKLYTITPQAFAREQQYSMNSRQLFDSVWSYSSLEHDGLGRYRDPLNPYGDFQTMVKISCILKPGGFLFLGVPLGLQDFIQFNLHRIYGPIRLPMMYQYFHIVEVLGGSLPSELGVFIQPFVV